MRKANEFEREMPYLSRRARLAFIKEVQIDALKHASDLAYNHAVGRNCQTCVAIAYAIAKNIERSIAK